MNQLPLKKDQNGDVSFKNCAILTAIQALSGICDMDAGRHEEVYSHFISTKTTCRKMPVCDTIRLPGS